MSTTSAKSDARNLSDYQTVDKSPQTHYVRDLSTFVRSKINPKHTTNMQNKSIVLKGAEREQLAAWVQACGGARDCAAKAGISKSVLYKLLAEGHAHPSTINRLRPMVATFRIKALVCAEFNITESELFDKQPDKETAQAKKACIYLLRKHTSIGRQAIAEMFSYAVVRLVNRVVVEVKSMIEDNYHDMRTYISRIECQIKE